MPLMLDDFGPLTLSQTNLPHTVAVEDKMGERRNTGLNRNL